MEWHPQLFMNYNTNQEKEEQKKQACWKTTVEFAVHQTQFYFWVLRMECFNFHTLKQTIREL